MKLQLPPAPGQYDERDQNTVRRLLTEALFKLLERNGEIEIGPRSARLVAVSPNGTRWSLGVSDAGATTWTALT